MKDFIENQYGRAVREASPYERFAVSTVGAAISRPPMTKLPPIGRLIAAPTDANGGAAPYLLSAMVKVNSVRPSRLVT